ncbi:LysR family transcriptional regulator [Mangrovicoccus sp. HB161399]|uniref:LysR family transcriptional regulator n=1 Tax=Mangrovicoccus sp. HB161399 TaxID=2720392 RepID=UPI001552005E|nr:LysR family transcriptional regulator [Mangrovicoccus sp. HB161399]
MDLQGRDLALLVSLDVLLEECSVTRAAKRLGISQPAMSAQLARLRDLFGDELLAGNAHGMTLTPRAEAMRSRLGAALEDLRQVVTEARDFDPAADARRIRLAGTDLAFALVLPALLAMLAERAPGVTLDCRPLDPAQVAADLEGGALDFAIMRSENAPESFPGRRLGGAEFQVIWRRDHPALCGGMTLDAFCALPHAVAVAEGAWVAEAVEAALAALGRRRRVALSLPNFLLLPEVIRATDLVAVVPEPMAAACGPGICRAAPPVALPGSQIYLGWHRRLQGDPAARWFRGLVAEATARYRRDGA